MKLPVEALTREAFALFGDVIEADASRSSFAINEGSSQRFHDLAQLDAGDGGRLVVSIFRAQPRCLPLTLTLLERHPKGSQAFMPLSGQPFLVVVAPRSDRIDRAQIRAFLANGRQGVNFAPGVWHHPLLALYSESDFLVIDRNDPHGNCEEQKLDAPRFIHLDLNAKLIKGLTGVVQC